jgi:hypothetical protein
MDLREELERRIRERGVRVNERLELLRLVLENEEKPTGTSAVDGKCNELAENVRQAARRLRGAID